MHQVGETDRRNNNNYNNENYYENENPILDSFSAYFKNSPKSNQDEFRDVLNGILFYTERSIR